MFRMQVKAGLPGRRGNPLDAVLLVTHGMERPTVRLDSATQSPADWEGGKSLGGFSESEMLGVEVIFRVLKIFFFF